MAILTLFYDPKRYIAVRMESLRRLVILLIVALIGFGPVAAQASACAHPQASSLVQSGEIHASAASGGQAKNGHEAASAKAQHSIPSNDKNAPHCTTCCLAHVVGTPLTSAVTETNLVLRSVRIGLPRDWAGVPDRAPNALLRPPRA
jgi:hypothetical protein